MEGRDGVFSDSEGCGGCWLWVSTWSVVARFRTQKEDLRVRLDGGGLGGRSAAATACVRNGASNDAPNDSRRVRFSWNALLVATAATGRFSGVGGTEGTGGTGGTWAGSRAGSRCAMSWPNDLLFRSTGFDATRLGLGR